MSQFRLITDAQLSSLVATANDPPTQAFIDAWVPAIEDEVERYLNRRLRYDEDITEYFDPSDDDYVLLSRRPVAAVTSVKYDPQGGYGQITGTFGSGTLLTAGVDYYLQIDGEGKFAGKSETGTLYRVGRSWGSDRKWQAGLLASARAEQRGTVQVVYNGGYVLDEDPYINEVPSVVSSAIGQALCVWYTSLANVGVVSGESEEGYSYSQVLGMNLGDNIFASVRQMLKALRTYRPGYGRT